MTACWVWLKLCWVWLKAHWPDKGTLPQWVGAVATAVVAGTTIWALISAQPIFENQHLKEENFQLQTQLESDRAAYLSLRGETWNFVCRQIGARIRAVTESSIFVWFAFPNKGFPDKSQDLMIGEPLGLRNPTDAENGRELLLTEAANPDYKALLAGDQPALGLFIAGIIASDLEAMEGPFDPPNALTEQDIEQWFTAAVRRTELLTRFKEITAPFEAQCTAANPARTSPPT